VQQISRQLWVKLVFACLGLFGAAIAITGVLVALPAPAIGGTCGPGHGSESPIVAFFDPITIGAGTEPAATNATGHASWLAFVGECQASTDGRVLAVLAILVLSVGVAIGGPKLVLRKTRDAASSPPLSA
jgi:hypothetical protein